MSDVLAKFAALPRAAKWGIGAVLVIIVYFAAVEPALNFVNSVRAKADRIENNIARDAALSDPKSDDGRMVVLGREQFGSPLRPGATGVAPENLYRLVDRVLREHGIEDASIAERSAQLRSDLLDAVVGSSTVNKFILEVSFDADSVTALDVLAALEQAPEVSSIGRVRLDKLAARSTSNGESGDTLRVTLAPEIWITADVNSGGAR